MNIIKTQNNNLIKHNGTRIDAVFRHTKNLINKYEKTNLQEVLHFLRWNAQRRYFCNI
jgi:hypothetical protein